MLFNYGINIFRSPFYNSIYPVKKSFYSLSSTEQYLWAETLRSDLSLFKSQLIHILGMWYCANYLNFLSLSKSIYKNGYKICIL